MSLWLMEQRDNFRLHFLKWKSAEDFQQLGIAGFEALGTNAAPAVEELSKLLNDKKRAYAAIRCLAAIGKPAEASICKALTSPDSQVREVSMSALAGVTDDVAVYIERLTNSLNDPDVNVRLLTIRYIGMQRNAPDLAVPILIKELANSDPSESEQATEYLADFGTNAAAAYPALSNIVMKGQSLNAANAALRTLSIIAPDKALPMVLQCYHSSTGLRRLAAFGILCAYSPTTPEIEATIESAVDDPNMMVSGRAKMLLTEQYLQAHPIESQFSNDPICEGKPLGEWLKMQSSDGKFSKQAENALHQMGTNTFSGLLARLVYVQPPFGLRAFQINIDAVRAFIMLGDQTKPVLPKLQMIMDGTNKDVVLCAMLAACGTGSNAIPVLAKGLTNQFATVRIQAATTLFGTFYDKYPQQCRHAIPLLTKLLNDPDQSVRWSATNLPKGIVPAGTTNIGIK